MFKTFVLRFDVAQFCYYNGENVDEVESKIEKTIEEYCSKENVSEIQRAVVTSIVEGNASFIVTITSQFEKT